MSQTNHLNPSNPLFSPVQIGDIQCANRVFMSPLTRCRALPGSDAPHALNALYYQQRSGAGLIISEATQVHPTGKGYHGAPGIYSPEQEAGWKLVTEAVHAKGGKIVAQLWHVGAISHPDYQPDGALPLTASDGFNPGGVTTTQNGKKERVAARALTLSEIDMLIEAYRQSAMVAKRAGFDGVEIHSANGYLLEQFIRDASNKRTDSYGGSIENRIKLTLQVIDVCIDVFGSRRVGIRLSPVSKANNAQHDSNTQATYGTLVNELARRNIAFIDFVEGNTGQARELDGFDFQAARKILQAHGVAYVANNKITRDMATEALVNDQADAVAFGVPYIANPDLAERFRVNAPLNTPNPKTFYIPVPEGYTDYPFMSAA